MKDVNYYNDLINELTSFGVTEKRMLEIRNELLQVIFDTKDSTHFDFLVKWNYHLHKRINYNKDNLEIPGNAQEVNAIASLIRRVLL